MRAFIAVSVLIVTASVVSLAAALVGFFSLALTGMLSGAVMLLVCIRWWPISQAGPPPKASHGRRAAVRRALIAALVAAAAGVLYFQPHEYFFGGWDPGVYLATGAGIARTGAIAIHDDLFAALDPEDRQLFVHERNQMIQKYPGFVIRDAAKGEIQPYFYYLYPVWIAVFMAAFGPSAGLLVAPIFAMLGLAALFLFVRELFGEKTALPAVLLFAFSIPVIWQARLPTAETTAFFFLFLAWLGISRALLGAGWGWLILGAASLWCALATKITTLVPAAMLLGGVLFWAAVEPERWRFRTAAALALAIACAFPYYLGPTAESSVVVVGPFGKRLAENPALLAVAGILAVVGFAVVSAGRGAIRRHGGLIRRIALAFLLTAGGFAYLVRPRIERSSDAANLVELGWFVTPLFLLVAAAGAARVLLRPGADRAAPVRLLYVAVSSGCAVILLLHKQIAPFYMWALRRYVPEVLPFFAVCAALAVSLLLEERPAKRAGRLIASLLLLVVVSLGLWRGRHLLSHRDYGGALAEIGRVAALIPDGSTAICFDSWLATPLHFVFRKNTLQVSDLTPEKARRVLEFAAKRVAGSGEDVLLVCAGENFFSPAVTFERVGRVPFSLEVLEQSKGYPHAIRPFDPTAVVFRLRPYRPGAGHRPSRIDVGSTHIGLGSGFQPPERSEGTDAKVTRARWAGPLASLDLPAPGDAGRWNLVVRAAAPRPAGDESPRVALAVDGREIGVVRIARAMAEYRVPFTVTAEAASRGSMTVKLDSETFNPASRGLSRDNRDLGILLESIAVEPAF